MEVIHINKVVKSVSFYHLISISAFTIGVIYYYFLRDSTIVALWLGIDDNHTFNKYTLYFNSLPSFVHVFSFSIFTWLVLEKHYANTSILFWVTLNVIFEIGQMINIYYLTWLPKLLQQYFQRGTYDLGDIIAIIVGGICAKIVIDFKYYNIKY